MKAHKRQKDTKFTIDVGTKFDLIVLNELHNGFAKFGPERCKKFYFEMIKRHRELCEKYQSNGDDSHYLIIKERLKADGIDIDAIQKEAEKL